MLNGAEWYVVDCTLSRVGECGEGENALGVGIGWLEICGSAFVLLELVCCAAKVPTLRGVVLIVGIVAKGAGVPHVWKWRRRRIGASDAVIPAVPGKLEISAACIIPKTTTNQTPFPRRAEYLGEDIKKSALSASVWPR